MAVDRQLLERHKALARRLAARARAVRFLSRTLLTIYAIVLLVLLGQSESVWAGARHLSDLAYDAYIGGAGSYYVSQKLAGRAAELGASTVGMLVNAAIRALEVIGIFAGLAVHRRRYSIGALEQKYTRLRVEQIPELRKMLDRLTGLLGVEGNSIVVWSNRSMHVAPSIVQARGHPQMLLPMGFLFLLSRDRPAAEVMLAHELGHVVQRDSQLWMDAWVASRLVLRMIVPLEALRVIVSIASAQLAWGAAVASFVPLGVALSIAAFALASRAKSELAADVAAVGCCGARQVSTTIERYLREDLNVTELRARRLANVASVAS